MYSMVKLNKFSLKEVNIIFFVFIVLSVAVSINMSISLRRGRDATRKDDMSALQKAIDTYYQKYRIFPISSNDGKIIGCFDEKPKVDKSTGFPLNAVVCNWGENKFESINTMPRDPSYQKGSSYLYISNGKKYELYVSLEGEDEVEYSQSVVVKNLHCGTRICNYGRGSVL